MALRLHGMRRVAANSVNMNGDGVHGRRMWFMNNPVALVRALMDPGRISATCTVTASIVVDAVLTRGEKVQVGFFTRSEWCQADCEHLPAYVRWSVPNPDFGQASFSTWFTGYSDQQGLLFPLGYNTRLDGGLSISCAYMSINMTSIAIFRTSPLPRRSGIRPLRPTTPPGLS